MDYDTFEEQMDLLGDRYPKGRLREKPLAIYFDLLKFIPSVPFVEIVKDVMGSERFFPIPDLLKKAWFDWLRAHSDFIYREKAAKTDCGECGGSGIIDFIRVPPWILEAGKYAGIAEENLWKNMSNVYSNSCRCGSCQNWKGEMLTKSARLTRAELIEKGWKPLPIGAYPGAQWENWPEFFDKLTDLGHWKPEFLPAWAKQAEDRAQRDVEKLADENIQKMPDPTDHNEQHQEVIPF